MIKSVTILSLDGSTEVSIQSNVNHEKAIVFFAFGGIGELPTFITVNAYEVKDMLEAALCNVDELIANVEQRVD